MQWFRNLDARPRLLISFGILMLFTLGISYLAISNLGKANDRVDSLYHTDMVGATHANGITINITSIRGDDLNAMYHASDLAAVASAEKDELGNMADLHTNLDAAEKLFVTPKGIEQLNIMKKALPDYEREQGDLFRALRARDMTGANAALDAAIQSRAVILGASNVARTLKQDHAEEELQSNNQLYQSSRTMMLSVCGISLALGLFLSFAIARGFSVPLGEAVVSLERVAEGDLTATLEIDTKDEVGRMAEALNQALEKLRTTMLEVSEGATNVSSSSQELAAATESIASGAQEQAASLEETSASLEEITATVRQSADNAKQASQLASGSRDAAEQGEAVVSSAVAGMAEINSASAKISDIIGTIDEIAFQTNLLAVNAAVEAARAGEEGRGFAVVAAEVRSLAQRSAEAAKEIKGLIQDSLRKVERGTELVNKSGETLEGIVASVKRVTDIVGEIAAAAAEQSTGIEQVSTAMTQMDHVTQSNSAQTEELSSTAEALSDQSVRLMELVKTFTLDKGGRGGRTLAAPNRSAAPARAKSAKSPVAAARTVAKRIKASGSLASQASAVRQSGLAAAAASNVSDEASFGEF